MPPTRPLAVVVANPSKPAATGALRHQLTDALDGAGYHVHHLTTTVRAPGGPQARWAVRHGAALVVAAGGDGTVRQVAGALAGTGTTLGVLPLGTANLAARALGVPVPGLAGPALRLAGPAGRVPGRAGSRQRALEQALRVLTDGVPHPADLLQVRVLPAGVPACSPGTHSTDGTPAPGTGPDWEPCLAVAGAGFDGALVATAEGPFAPLKARAGWLAYVAAALAHLHGPRPDVEVVAGGTRQRLRARTVLVANGGRLPAGLTLLPAARPDDGLADVAAVDVRGGLAGWTSLALQVLPPRPGTYRDPRGGLAGAVLLRGGDVTVRLREPAPVQVDGDLLGPASVLRVRVLPGALRVLVPR